MFADIIPLLKSKIQRLQNSSVWELWG